MGDDKSNTVCVVDAPTEGDKQDVGDDIVDSPEVECVGDERSRTDFEVDASGLDDNATFDADTSVVDGKDVRADKCKIVFPFVGVNRLDVVSRTGIDIDVATSTTLCIGVAVEWVAFNVGPTTQLDAFDDFIDDTTVSEVDGIGGVSDIAGYFIDITSGLIVVLAVVTITPDI